MQLHFSLRYLLYGAGVCGLLAATFANYVLQELGHDEGMYLGASYLAMEHDLYRELGYFQTPYVPLVLSRIYLWFDVQYFLLWGRAIAFLHHALTLGLLAAIAWHFTKSGLVTFLFTMWLGLNGFLYGAAYSIDNTTFATTYALAAFYALLRAHEGGWTSSALIGAAGFLIALAPGFKLNYLALTAGFAVAVAMFSSRRALGVFLLGWGMGLAPLAHVALTRWTSFWYDNVVWHRSVLAMNVEEMGARAVLAGFVGDAGHYLLGGSWLSTVVVLSALALVLLRSEGKRFWTFDRTLIALLVGTTLACIAAMGAVRFWYLQPVAILVALLVPSVYRELTKRRTNVVALLALSALVSGLVQLPSLRHAPRALGSDTWVPLRYAAMGGIVAQLPRDGRLESVAVIGNPAIAYGVEGGLPLASAAATGAFVRVSSPLLVGETPRIATYDGLERGGWDMVIATVDYVLPRAEVTPGAWCHGERPESPFDALFDRLCDSGFRTLMVGSGPSRAVVFYR